MKKSPPLVRWFLVVVIAFGIVITGIAVSPLGKIVNSIFTVTRGHRSLKARDDARDIGAVMAAALLDPNLATKKQIPAEDPEMPYQLRKLNPVFLSLDPENGVASLEFGGGFYHYGYQVQKQSNGSYRMLCYGENDDDIADLGVIPRAAIPRLTSL